MPALSVAAVALLAVSCRAPRRAPEPAAELPAPAATAEAAECTAAELRCRDERQAERCENGAWHAQRCGDSLCLDGACVPLGDGDVRVEPGKLMRPVGAAFIDAWTSYGPIADATLDELTATAAGPFGGDPKLREARCAPAGFVAVDEPGSPRAGTHHHLLTGLVVVGAARHAVLRLSARGRVRVWLNGLLVADRDEPGSQRSPSRPFPDEMLVPVDLAPGANPLAVGVTQARGDPTGFWLRFGEPDGALSDYRFAPSHGLGCSLGEMVAPALVARLREGGFSPRLSLKLDGLAPTSSASLAVKLLLPAPWTKPGTKDPPRDETLVERRFSRDELVHGDAVEARVQAAKKGPVEIAAELGNLRKSWAVEYRGAQTDRLAALVSRYLGGDAERRAPADLPAGLDADARASFESDLRTVALAAEQAHPVPGHLPYGAAGGDGSFLQARTDDLAKMAAEIDSGRDPYAGRTGVMFRAYRSPLDGRLQPYVLYVPPRIKAVGPKFTQKTLPLIVVYHGLYNPPALALRILVGQGPKETEDHAFASRHMPFFPDLGAILVAPGGYQDAGQRTVGEADVLDVLAHLKRLYPIDDRRVSITGYSLGGTVSFTVPLHYPTLFSAAAPLCGYPNLTSYWDVAHADKRPFEEAMLDKGYIANYAENGMYLPLHIVHGGKDAPSRSAVMADRYKALGYSRIFQIEPDLGHDVWDKGYEKGNMVAWLRTRRRPERPLHVRLKTGFLRYDRAYWLRLIAFESEEKLAYLDARYRDKERRFEIHAEGAHAFAIDASAFPEAASAIIDGQTLELGRGDKPGELFFVKGPGGWSPSDREPARSGHKRPGVAGPLDDVLRHPLVIVYGTQLANEAEANRMTAEHWSSYDSWAGAHFPVLSDRDASDQLLKGKSIVLIGSPRSNSVTARFAKDLPVQFEDGALVFRGRRYPGQDVGISLIRPSPLDPDQYLVLHAGVGYAGTLASRHLPRQVPDFVIYDGRIRAAVGGEVLGPRDVLAAGFFGDDWE